MDHGLVPQGSEEFADSVYHSSLPHVRRCAIKLNDMAIVYVNAVLNKVTLRNSCGRREIRKVTENF
jgi:hypothetical protein